MPKSQIKFKVAASAGEAEYILEPLTRKEAMRVFHTALSTILSAVGASLKSAKTEDPQAAILSAVSALDFEKIYPVAEACFRFATIITPGKVTEIKELADSDYFDDRPDEFYLALYRAVEANWPSFFSKLAGLLPGFGAPAAAEVPAEL